MYPFLSLILFCLYHCITTLPHIKNVTMWQISTYCIPNTFRFNQYLFYLHYLTWFFFTRKCFVIFFWIFRLSNSDYLNWIVTVRVSCMYLFLVPNTTAIYCHDLTFQSLVCSYSKIMCIAIFYRYWSIVFLVIVFSIYCRLRLLLIFF